MVLFVCDFYENVIRLSEWSKHLKIPSCIVMVIFRLEFKIADHLLRGTKTIRNVDLSRNTFEKTYYIYGCGHDGEDEVSESIDLSVEPPSHDGTQKSEIETAPMVSLSGEEWIVLLGDLNSNAWDLLVDRFGADLRRDIKASLRSKGLSEALFEDIEQQVWVTAIEQFSDFEWQGEDKLYHWLRSIASWHVKTLRRKSKDVASLDEIDDRPESVFALDFFLYINGMVQDSPEVEAELMDDLRILSHAMRNLTKRDQEILLRRLVLRETPRDMASDYGVEAATISTILVRAKETIRSQLPPNYWDKH